MEVARDKLTVDVLRVIQQIFGLINEDVVHIVYVHSLRQQKNNFKKFQKIVMILLKTELIKTLFYILLTVLTIDSFAIHWST